MIDGVSIGIKISSLKEKDDLFLPFTGNNLLQAPSYKDRMFIKLKKDRDILKNAVKNENYPIVNVKGSSDDNMAAIKDFSISMKKHGYTCPPRAYLDLLKDLSSASSTVKMLQPFDNKLLKELRTSLSSPDSNVLRDPELRSLQDCLRSMYPVFMERLNGLAVPARPQDDHLPVHVRDIFVRLLDFIINFHRDLPVRTETDYRARGDGEIKGQILPLFPLRYVPVNRYFLVIMVYSV